MVELPGSLERSTLGDAFGALHRGRVTGTLWLHELSAGREHRHVVVWREGLIHHVETTRQRGPSADAAQRRAAEHWTANDPQRAALLERLEALFQLTHAKLSFRVMGPQPPCTAEPLGPNEFLHGRRRSRDGERRTPAPPTAAAPPPSPPPPNPPPPPSPPPPESARARALRTLGLAGDPGTDAVRAAFRRLAWHWHPDRHPGASESARALLCRRFAQITGAYEQLIGLR